MNRFHLRNSLLLLLFTIILGGCNPSNTMLSTTTNLVAPVSRTPAHLNLTPTQLNIKTDGEKITLTQTVRPSFTPKPTRTNTVTLLPRLSSIESQKYIDQLLKNNGNCELPCIWGIMPGETSALDAKQLLLTFTTYGGQGNGSDSTANGFYFRFIGNKQRDLSYIGLSVEEGQVIALALTAPATRDRYSLDQLLSRYGSPTQIFVRTVSVYPSENIPFDLFFYYDDIGFAATFKYNATATENFLVVCPKNQRIGPLITTWVPSIQKSPYEVFGSSLTNAKDIEESLNLTRNQFTELFKDPNTEYCFQTPIGIW